MDKHSTKINSKDLDEYLNFSDLPITLNCYNCNQQIDIFEELEPIPNDDYNQ